MQIRFEEAKRDEWNKNCMKSEKFRLNVVRWAAADDVDESCKKHKQKSAAHTHNDVDGGCCKRQNINSLHN